MQSERVAAAAACAFALPFYLRDEFRLELVEELEIEVVLRREASSPTTAFIACTSLPVVVQEREVVEGRERCEVRVVEWGGR